MLPKKPGSGASPAKLVVKRMNSQFDMEKMLGNVWRGDCMSFMAQMPDRSVDFTLTDIPYAGVNRESNGIRVFDKGAADEITFPLKEFTENLHRLSRNGMVIFCGFEQVSPIYETLRAKNDGTVRLLCWRKNNPSPVNADNMYLSALETAVWFQPFSCIHPWRKSHKSALLRYNCGTSKEHPTEKNPLLLEDILRHNVNGRHGEEKGDIVFDPCSGSGSHLLAALRFGCRIIGCELDPKFHELARKRILTATRQVQEALLEHYNSTPGIPDHMKVIPSIEVRSETPDSLETEENGIHNGDPVKHMRTMRENSVSMVFSDLSGYTKKGRLDPAGKTVNDRENIDFLQLMEEAERISQKTIVFLCNPENFSEIYAHFNRAKGSIRAIAFEDGSPNVTEPNDYAYRENVMLGVWFKKQNAHNTLQNFFKSNVFCYDENDPANRKRFPSDRNYMTWQEFLADLILDNTEDVLTKISKTLPSLEIPKNVRNSVEKMLKSAKSVQDFRENLKRAQFPAGENGEPSHLAESLLNLCSMAGETVFDPCAGNGEILATAKRYGRKIAGCEPDPARFRKALASLEEANQSAQVSDTREKRVRKVKAADMRGSLLGILPSN